MPITFDPSAKRIVLDSTSVTASEIWSRWVDWVATSDNSKYLPALQQVGGDDLGGGLSIPIYIFELNGWRVRPMESSHALTITGNLFVSGGGIPVVNTLGAYNVSVQYTVPVQAQAVATGGGGGSGLTVDQAAQLFEMWKLHGLDPLNPLVVSSVQRAAGAGVVQSIAEAAGVTTVQRV